MAQFDGWELEGAVVCSRALLLNVCMCHLFTTSAVSGVMGVRETKEKV